MCPPARPQLPPGAALVPRPARSLPGADPTRGGACTRAPVPTREGAHHVQQGHVVQQPLQQRHARGHQLPAQLLEDLPGTTWMPWMGGSPLLPPCPLWTIHPSTHPSTHPPTHQRTAEGWGRRVHTSSHPDFRGAEGWGRGKGGHQLPTQLLQHRIKVGIGRVAQVKGGGDGRKLPDGGKGTSTLTCPLTLHAP